VGCPARDPVVIEDHNAVVRCLAFHSTPEGKRFLSSGSFDRTVRIRETSL